MGSGESPVGPNARDAASERIGPDTAQAYGAAIAEYIKMMREEGMPEADTIYIGRHPEFPHVGLPRRIENTAVRIITPSEAGQLKHGERFVYLNVIGWLSPGRAEFQVIRFQQDMHHRPDGRDDRHLVFGMRDGQLVLEPSER